MPWLNRDRLKVPTIATAFDASSIAIERTPAQTKSCRSVITGSQPSTAVPKAESRTAAGSAASARNGKIDATPAIAHGRLYLRVGDRLDCHAKR
jgi:hypothetical protein